MKNSRRNFIRTSAAFTAAVGVGATFPSAFSMAMPGAQKKIRVGAIGINGMGWADLKAILKHPDTECTALCDVDKNVLDKRKKELADEGIKPKGYGNYKDLLAAKDVDVVVIGTPDHWHCLQLIDACAAGKDVYVEKPLGNSIAECEAMVKAARKYDRIVQVGQWQRSQKHFRDAVDFVHSGKLGEIRLVKAWAYQGWMKSIPVKPDGPAPEGVDYAGWLGPAEKRPFNPNRFHFEFRWFWDYAGGLMTDWGVHMLDYALIGMKATTPRSVMASGGKFAYPDDAAETPDTLTTVFEFDDFNVQWEHANGIDGGPYGRNHGVAFIGNKGTLVLNRDGWEVIPEKDRMEAVPLQKKVDNGLDLHAVNFIEAVQQRDKSLLHCPVEAGAHIAVFSQMGNIAYRTGKKIYWDASKKNFNDSDADKLIAASYHNGYKIPVL
ncbi:Gfo/Idh/MocA family protein [Sinomicrobium weinanense]|uniref:Gfo/Idh/MocA family oxidoreductase n=1 Tax=Sinomicrobium weinanense TaxID=2842200 RepID=A0A926JTB1_9FLAO|nr:Gfo/Idh/MocA family oxidoreductase [Sinomicrobium weinanense]MBC9797113.1 Gfo/Idh/MocA family oxidoreductase [Sinomicrobium weinanense]MBU3124809.1 Gfo/Idh/MocA family oxidoreductase [Sinomicrobium weinanense]